jgi:hypothetical protein
MVGLYTNRHSLGPWPQTPVRSRSGLPLRNQPVPWHVADPKFLGRRLDGRLLVGGIKRSRRARTTFPRFVLARGRGGAAHTSTASALRSDGGQAPTRLCQSRSGFAQQTTLMQPLKDADDLGKVPRL